MTFTSYGLYFSQYLFFGDFVCVEGIKKLV